MSNNSKEYRKRASEALNRIGKYNADYDQILANLDAITKASMDGVEQEKLSVRDGVLPVVEKYPQVAVQAEMGKLAVLKELSRLAEMEEVDTQVSVSIVLGSLEAALGVDDEPET